MMASLVSWCRGVMDVWWQDDAVVWLAMVACHRAPAPPALAVRYLRTPCGRAETAPRVLVFSHSLTDAPRSPAFVPPSGACLALSMSWLSNMATEKLELVQPRTLGAASRVEGVTPAAVIQLMQHVKHGHYRSTSNPDSA